MKQRFIIASLLLAVAGLQTAFAQKMIVTLTDGQVVKYNVTKVEHVTFEEAISCEAVDLALPSGTLWAAFNVGATKPEEYGDFFAWGEVSPKTEYEWTNYKFGNGLEDAMTKYCVQSEHGLNGFTDCNTELLPEDDAASYNWDESWQIPSKDQLDELGNSAYTTISWRAVNGVYGLEVKSKFNGNSIFLPATGSHEGIFEGSYGYYWSRSLNTDESRGAFQMFLNYRSLSTNSTSRYVGRVIRPVLVEKAAPILVSSIELDETTLSLFPGQSIKIMANPLPINARNRNVVWSSSNTDVATVNQTGNVTAVGYGDCTITCSAKDGSGVSAECEVKVTKPVESIVLGRTELVLSPGDAKYFSYEVLPTDATNRRVTWSSSNPDIASVTDWSGTIYGHCEGSCTITCSATDGSGVYAECHVTVRTLQGTTDGHEWVDLGLPSGTLWATYNIGAYLNSPAAGGNYYAWGETETKSDYSWETYTFCQGSYNTLTKYCCQGDYGFECFTDTLTELLPEDDAATVNWGDGWQIPSKEQMEELFNEEYVTLSWEHRRVTSVGNDISGRVIRSKTTDKSIFLPLAGWYDGTELKKKGTTMTFSQGKYWTRTLSPRYSCYVYYQSLGSGGNDLPLNEFYRCYGYPVRPVRKK